MNFIHFGLRMEIEKLYLEWCEKEGIANKPNSFVVFLMEKGWLNESKVIEDLEGRKIEPSFKVDEIGDDDPTMHAIAHLQKVGWLQEHDKALTESQTCETCRFEWFEPECDSCDDAYSNWQPQAEPQTEYPRCAINGTPFDECGFCKHFNCDTCKCEAKDKPQSKRELIRREDAIQAIKAYLDLCCLTEAKFHKEFEDYNDEIARGIISVIVEPSNNEKYRCYKCSWWDYDQSSQTMYKMNCNGIAWKIESSKVEDKP